MSLSNARTLVVVIVAAAPTLLVAGCSGQSETADWTTVAYPLDQALRGRSAESAAVVENGSPGSDDPAVVGGLLTYDGSADEFMRMASHAATTAGVDTIVCAATDRRAASRNLSDGDADADLPAYACQLTWNGHPFGGMFIVEHETTISVDYAVGPDGGSWTAAG